MPDAETLMRSRYTAFVQQNESYLLATWHPGTRPAGLNLQDEVPPQWLGLTVVRHTRDDEDHAQVAFIARFKVGGRAQRLHETSRFVRENGRWFYIDGEISNG